MSDSGLSSARDGFYCRFVGSSLGIEVRLSLEATDRIALFVPAELGPRLSLPNHCTRYCKLCIVLICIIYGCM